MEDSKVDKLEAANADKEETSETLKLMAEGL